MKIITEEDKRKKKNGALGWFFTLGGNPEKEAEFFNHVMGTDVQQGDGEGSGEATVGGDAGSSSGGATGSAAGAGGAQ